MCASVHGAVYGKIDPQWTQKVQGYWRSLRFKHIECVFPSIPFVVDSSSNLEFEPIEFYRKNFTNQIDWQTHLSVCEVIKNLLNASFYFQTHHQAATITM